MKLTEQILSTINKNHKDLGSLLVEHTNLTNEQLSDALDVQEKTGEDLEAVLLKKNYIHSHDIIKAICKIMNLPFVEDIKVDDIDPNIVKEININYSKNHEVLPIFETDYTLTLVMANPFNYQVINDLQVIFDKEVHVLVANPLKIQDAINRVYEKANKHLVDIIEDEFEENLDIDGPIDILDAGADEAPVIRFVNSIIFRAVKEGASDIHIEPYERETIYRFRINGVMTEVLRQPKKTHAAVSSRIKVMAKLDIAEKRLPQDGRIKIKIAGKDIDIRLSTVPVQYGERIVMRVLEKSNNILQLKTLGFEGEILKELDTLSEQKHGIIYVSGPTGHGKTTTLFAVLDKINKPDRMIITVEDPVEYEMDGVSQIQVNPKIDLTFAVALRHILRQNPDVIMVGETRDQETARMAIEASNTGHLVLSTIHTNDSSSVPTRLMDMGIQPFLIASALSAALAQRLIRILCKDCKESYEAQPGEFEILGLKYDAKDPKTFYKPKGCKECNFMGYSGRTIVSELLIINDEIRALLMARSDSQTIKKAAVKSGMVTLRQDALKKIIQGITSVEEVVRAINEEETS